MATWRQIARATTKYAREVERQQRRAVAAQLKQQKEADSALRERQRELAKLRRTAELAQRSADKAYAKLQKEAYLAGRKAEAEALTRDASETIEAFDTILLATISVNDTVDFRDLYPSESFVPPEAPATAQPTPPNKDQFLTTAVTAPGLLEQLFGFGQSKRLAALERATAEYEQAVAEYEQRLSLWHEQQRQHVAGAKAARQQWQTEMDAKRADVDAFRAAYAEGDPDAVTAYCAMVLERSVYPEGFPQQFELAYIPESKELVVQYQLPPLDVIPTIREYRYVQSGDKMSEIALKPRERTALYERVVAQVPLRTMHELFEADQGQHLMSVVFNGIVHTVDPRTGQDVSPCLVTVQAQREPFLALDLSRVDPIACLKGLRAHVSPAAGELAPVKPIVNFEMIDKRFVQEQDVLSSLDDRTNIYEMDPFAFEHLICNLFSKIGLEARLTRSSRDGGVDVVAFDPRPVFGGKYVIQAKRYRNTVEVSAVRDLYGSMMNENAAKGILVTTSTFGPDARSFAKDKPIELIDGQNLLYLLNEHGIQAKIDFANQS